MRIDCSNFSTYISPHDPIFSLSGLLFLIPKASPVTLLLILELASHTILTDPPHLHRTVCSLLLQCFVSYYYQLTPYDSRSNSQHVLYLVADHGWTKEDSITYYDDPFPGMPNSHYFILLAWQISLYSNLILN